MTRGLYRELSGYTGINPPSAIRCKTTEYSRVFLSDKAAFATMGCVMCSPLLGGWSFSSKQPRRNTCLEMSLFPSSCLSQYQRVSGLHYVSSFSDAEDCCEDSPVSEDSDSEMT